MLTPFERYQHAIQTKQFIADKHQAMVIEQLQALYQQLLIPQPTFAKLFGKPQTIKGLYIWGSVGAGKTWLMDLFYESLPFNLKWRRHFHEFMHDIHDQLQRYQGKSDPLIKIAKQIAKQTKVLCFDEFFVNDIGDAMILANLLDALFKEQVVIVATSNTAPEYLYKDGLQRARFSPAISAIKKHMNILHIQTNKDFRLRELEQAGVFFCPENEDNLHQLNLLFGKLAHGEIKRQKDIYLYDRSIKTIAHAENILWVDFKQICHVPRSQMDYLAITKRYPLVIISNLQHITDKDMNTARYLINLIDIFYDTHTALILSSHAPLDNIYTDGELIKDFQRTKSRLQEMQSTAYLAKHLGKKL
jgi:cell division protein ZapE